MNSKKLNASIKDYIYENFNKTLSDDEIRDLIDKAFKGVGSYVSLGEIDTILKSINLFENYEKFSAFFAYLRELDDWWHVRRNITELENHYAPLYFKNDLQYRIDVFCNNEMNRWNKSVYTTSFTKEEQSSLEVIGKILDIDSRFALLLFPFVKEKDKLLLMNKYPEDIYRYAYSHLTDDDKKYLFPKIKKENKIFMFRDKDQYTAFETIALRNKSILPRKLKEMYGKSYTEKTGLSVDDEDTFIYTLLNSNVLDNVFRNPVFNNDDIIAINAILNIFEDRKKDVTNIRKRIEEVKKKTSIEENSMCNFILANKDKEEKLKEYLDSKNITKDNFFNYIKGRKFLDKKLKEALLLILAKHYKTDYISVYDILDLIEESKERGISFYEVLNERDIDKKFFNTALNRLKEENPIMYDLIYESMNNNFSINKKMIRLYHSIISSKIKDYDLFVSRYKKTPEQVLEMFEDSPLFDEIHDSLLKWYDFKNGLPEEKNKKEI